MDLFDEPSELAEKAGEEPDHTVQRYLELTCRVLPRMARDGERDWPVRHDHCFQRIILDAVAGDVWYRHIARPAYKHLTAAQAARAVALCQDVMDGRADLHALNRQSLRWRGKAGP
ncbi:MAG: hypothetical protein ACFB6R_00610 [Alphaproteobacteria bacterium]